MKTHRVATRERHALLKDAQSTTTTTQQQWSHRDRAFKPRYEFGKHLKNLSSVQNQNWPTLSQQHTRFRMNDFKTIDAFPKLKEPVITNLDSQFSTKNASKGKKSL